MRASLVLVVAALAVLLCAPANAEDIHPVVRLEVKSRALAFGGATFGERGAYEQIVAVAHMQIDPRARANRGIVDLGRAPRDAKGLVHYDIDVVILRPQNAAQARRVMVFDVVNRGNSTLTPLSGGSRADPEGNGFLMRQGYTLVASGWQGDVTQVGAVGARFPIATNKGRPITGRISTQTVFDDLSTNRITLPYPAASLRQRAAELTVRQYPADAAQVIPPSHWRFEENGHVRVERPANMDAGAIYRFSYIARDPRVMGLGFAAARDLIAFLRHGGGAANPLADIGTASCERNARGDCANPAGGTFDAVIAFGRSQTGRYLRDFVWQGFNRDLAGRRVLDGVVAMVPGARRTFTNARFSEPGRFSRQHEDHGVPGFDFPFTYATMRDPVTGRTDGILRRCAADGTCPKVFHIDTGGEFWQAAASLVGTGGGDADIAFPDNVRGYMFASAAHAPGLAPPHCALPANTLSYPPIVRALVVNMVDWTTARRDPPASRWPSIAALTRPEVLRTPDLSSLGVTWPRVVSYPEPPGRDWPMLVPTVDADGNEVPGIRLPKLVAPVGTYLGWNTRRSGFAKGDLCHIYGGFIPFASDGATRGGDPRPSLAERYSGDGDRRARFEQGVEALRRERLLLDEDATLMLREGYEPPDVRP